MGDARAQEDLGERHSGRGECEDPGVGMSLTCSQKGRKAQVNPGMVKKTGPSGELLDHGV